MNKNRKKVFIGLSGGVDSSVSAVLLAKAGYDVTGVFIKSWHPDWYPCTWKEDRRDAMRICALLGIPFLTLDLEKEYKKEVIDYLIAEYKMGRTPNPDVMCNKHIKFGLFFDFAMKNDADFVATGHYARIENEMLARGIDSEKDQSYFLWTLRKRELSKTIFPIGGLEKKEVRHLAKKFKLPNHEKPDSQGLCFVGNISMKEFLSHYIEFKSGDVLDLNGKIIGKHDGAMLYTIGERHGFIINDRTTLSKRKYVVSRDIEKNTITVDSEISKSNLSEFKIGNSNWTISPDPSRVYDLQSRYRQHPFKGRIKNDVVYCEKPEPNISIGQSLVVYDGDVCIGGGTIV